MQHIITKVKSRIYGKGRGWVFTQNHFLDIGSRGAIDMALTRLMKGGTIRRLTRGIYDYPKSHSKLGKLPPEPQMVAQAVAGKDNLRVQPSGAYAANLLGLSTQVPAKIIFLTDGATRTVTIGKQHIILKKTTPKNMMTAGKLSGLVIQALRYLGQKNVDQIVLNTLKIKIKKEDRVKLVDDVRFAPAWIAAIFRDLSES